MTDHDADRAKYILAMQQGMQAMSPEKMAERARRQQAGMQNAAQPYHPDQMHNLRNMWPSEFVPPQSNPTRMHRLRCWLRNLLG